MGFRRGLYHADGVWSQHEDRHVHGNAAGFLYGITPGVRGRDRGVASNSRKARPRQAYDRDGYGERRFRVSVSTPGGTPHPIRWRTGEGFKIQGKGLVPCVGEVVDEREFRAGQTEMRERLRRDCTKEGIVMRHVRRDAVSPFPSDTRNG